MVQGPGYQIRGLCCWWWSHAQMVIRAARPPSRPPQVGERSERGKGGEQRLGLQEVVEGEFLSLCLSVADLDAATMSETQTSKARKWPGASPAPGVLLGPHLSLSRARELQGPYHGLEMAVGFLAHAALRAFTTCPPSHPYGELLPILASSPSAHGLSCRLYWVGTASSGLGHVCGRTRQEPCSRWPCEDPGS